MKDSSDIRKGVAHQIYCPLPSQKDTRDEPINVADTGTYSISTSHINISVIPSFECNDFEIETKNISRISSKVQWYTIGILCYIHLIYCIDRLTLPGKIVTCG